MPKPNSTIATGNWRGPSGRTDLHAVLQEGLAITSDYQPLYDFTDATRFTDGKGFVDAN